MKKFLVAATVFTLAPLAWGQGLLTPPGPPAPSMKTLDQVEPRTPITHLPYTVSTSGSYYVTANLTGPGGIEIDADHVTIDLNGFTLDGGFGGGSGIFANGFRQHLLIHGGRVVHWSDHGIDLQQTLYADVVDLEVSGCGLDGIRLGERGRAEGCRATFNGGTGIWAFFDAVVERCRADFNATGIDTQERCVIRECLAERNQTGIRGMNDTTITDCRVRDNALNGIEVYGRSTVVGNRCETNSTTAILVVGSHSRLENNLCRGNSLGLEVLGSNTVVRGNRVLENQINYQLQPDNKLELLLCEIPEIIRWPAQVTLIGSLRCPIPGVDGIRVEASGVSIDLGGHTLEGPGFGSGHGIFQPSNDVHSLSVRNGSLTQWQGPDTAALRVEGGNNRIEQLQIFSNQMAVAAGPGALVTDVQVHENESNSLGPGIFAAAGSRIRDCVVTRNRGFGGTALGIFAGEGSVIEQCTVSSNEFSAGPATGIGGSSGTVIRDSAAYGNSSGGSLTAITLVDGGEIVGCSAFGNRSMTGMSVGINGGNGTVIRNCSSHSNHSDASHGYGILAGPGSIISGCASHRNGGTTTNSAGIFTLFDTAIYDCTVNQNTNHGIRVAGGSSVRDNQVNQNGHIGIEVVREGSVIERNQVNGNPVGISVVSSNNFIAANRVSSGAVSNNYSIAAGNAHGPIVDVVGVGDVSLAPNASHPLANLSY